MTKSIIECPWNVGDKLYCTAAATFSFTTFDGALSNALGKLRDGAEVFPIIQLRVIGVRMYTLRLGIDNTQEVVPIKSATEKTYKVIRNDTLGRIVLITEDMKDMVRLEWPESKPFHDAFGPIEEGKFRQIMHVCALHVNGNYKLIEVLDDQDW